MVTKSCSDDDDIVKFVNDNFLEPNGIEHSDWRVLEHKVGVDDKTVRAIYPSGRYGHAHLHDGDRG